MAASTGPALPEHWTELIAARENRRLCAQDVEAIKATLQADGDAPKSVMESQEHLDQILNRMLRRYQDSKEREWFSQRRAVVLGLETMFSEAKERKTTLKDIEASVGSEKEAWYRWVFRRHPEFLVVAGSGAEEEVRNILDDPDRSREELVSVVSQAIGMPPDWSDRVDAFVEKVEAASSKGDNAALKALFVSEFFKDPSTGETLEHAQKYLDMYESDDAMTLEAVIDKIIAAAREDRSSQAQRDTHQKRLDELRRAKTAFEQNHMQAKNQGADPNATTVDELYYSLPPCSVCGKNVDPSKVISCPLCQLIPQMGGQGSLTVYCSEECETKGFDAHMDHDHDCMAGDSCAQMVDEGVDVGHESSGPVACNECLDQKKMALFCSWRCAELNLGAHRKSKHEVETPGDQVHNLASPISQLFSMILTDEKTGLKFSD